MLDKAMVMAAVTTVVVVMILSYGHNKYLDGQRDMLVQIEKARLRDKQDMEEINNAIDGLTNDALLQRALNAVRSGNGG